jgi:hypothetical protein
LSWICKEHTDEDGDCICDLCEDFAFSKTTIGGYDAESKQATVFVEKAGKYSLVFADYENEKLANVDIVEYEFKEGINVVTQEDVSFALGSGDKVMLWSDMIHFVPICDALTVK